MRKADTTEYRNHSFEAECYLIRELTAAPECIPEARAAIRAEMFQDAHTRELWQILCDTFDADGADAINDITLYQRAPEKSWYREHILTLNASCSLTKRESYAAAIKSGYESLKAFELAEKLKTAAVRGTTLTEALEIIRAYEAEATATAPQIARAVSVTDAFNDLCAELGTGRGAIPTGIPSLDRATYGGLEAGNLVVIAARPSVGKTALALHLARGMAVAGRRVLFFSLEMTRAEIAKRLCIGTGAARAIDFRRDAPNWEALEESARVFAKWPLIIDDTSHRLEDIRAGIVLENNRHGLDIVFVDYLGMIESSRDDNTPQYLKIGDIAKQLKKLAQALHIPVVLLCQLNRESEKEDRDPRLSDLRDSGEIEHAADIALLLRREDEEGRRIVARVAKNRHGPKDFDIELERNESYTHFVEIPKR